jgi:predicted AlkP superfamily pyrophosphatase or phosphodiesterase
MKKTISLLLFLFVCGVAFAQQEKPYVILISADGFRWDYAQKYQAKNLLRLAAGGVKAQSMIPSFPSVTHPNHYALVSGLYPGHSGIVGNSFYDPARKAFFQGKDGNWFGGAPIWVSAEKQHMPTASFYWIDGNGPIAGVRPTYFMKAGKDKDMSTPERVKMLKQWLSLPEAQRPHLMLLYFPDCDHAGHNFGPDAPETREAVASVDDAVGQLSAVAEASGLPINFIFVSDHGMTLCDYQHPTPLPKAIDTNKFVVNNQNSLLNIYAKDQGDIATTYKKLKAETDENYTVYLNNEVPPALHYGGKDDTFKRVGDIVVLAKWPHTFNQGALKGMHGFDPAVVKDMHATFFAWGPAFKQHLEIAPFKNVEVYDLMTTILGLKGEPNDGQNILASQILK